MGSSSRSGPRQRPISSRAQPGRGRSGVIGALTFLGMAAGPFLGAAILSTVHPEEALIAGRPRELDDRRHRRARRGAGSSTSTCRSACSGSSSHGPSVPAGTRPGAPVGWTSWAPRSSGSRWPRACSALTLLGATTIAGTDLDPGAVSAGLGVLAAGGHAARHRPRPARPDDPFLDVRLFRSRSFSAAALVSLLTGYAFATAIIGGAVFVDRVLYGGPDEQRLALGSLAAATAVGALVSGFRRADRELPRRDPGRAGVERRRTGRHGHVGPGDGHPRRRRSAWASSASGSACRSRRARRPRSRLRAERRSASRRRSSRSPA